MNLFFFFFFHIPLKFENVPLIVITIKSAVKSVFIANRFDLKNRITDRPIGYLHVQCRPVKSYLQKYKFHPCLYFHFAVLPRRNKLGGLSRETDEEKAVGRNRRDGRALGTTASVSQVSESRTTRRKTRRERASGRAAENARRLAASSDSGRGSSSDENEATRNRGGSDRNAAAGQTLSLIHI